MRQLCRFETNSARRPDIVFAIFPRSSDVDSIAVRISSTPFRSPTSERSLVPIAHPRRCLAIMAVARLALGRRVMSEKIEKTDEEWRKLLTPEQFAVARQKGTERAFTGRYWDFHDKGVYLCVCCGNELFSSETKYDSGCGWPSFYAPLKEEQVETAADNTHGMRRTEVMCNRCGAHLGHVFEDGPQPTGLRYCMNSASMNFVKK
jgi:peptide-methionine (R)-S-oxide reductase